MVEEISKYNVDKKLCSENTSVVKEEIKNDNIDDHVLICKSDVNVKTEFLSFGMQTNILNDNVKIEEEIALENVKTEFGNRLLFCEHCQAYYGDYCSTCGMLVQILNRNVLSEPDTRELQEELPHGVLEIKGSPGQLGTFALKGIPEGVKFGPFTGLNTSERYWKIKGGRFIVSEGKSKLLNWMRHINPARSITEQNLLVLECEGSLYYRSTRVIQQDEELLVYFGGEYEKSLNENVEMDFIPGEEYIVKDVFACTLCCLGFSSGLHLAKHKIVCLNAVGEFSVEELELCPFCNIYMGESEYFTYHMTYCSERNVRNSIPESPKSQRAGGYGCRPRRSLSVEFEKDRDENLDVKVYECETCLGRFETRESMTAHVQNIHVNVEPRRTRQRQTKDNTKFEYPERAFRVKSEYLVEMRLETENIDECDFKCCLCDFKTTLSRHLKRHMKTEHFNQITYNCEMCEFKSKYKRHLMSHVKTKHLKEFRYNCEDCQYKTNSSDSLKKHRNVKHLKKYDFVCDECNYKTSRRWHLRRHKEARHIKEIIYACTSCDFKTPYKNNLEVHTNTMHLKIFDYKCEMCEFKASHKSYLERHIKTKHLEEFNYKCDKCDFKTSHRRDFERHTKAKHSGVWDYKCDLCERRTNNKATLENHIKKIHLQKFVYNCQFCEYTTHTKAYLKVHARIKHLNQYRYNCEKCQYKTNRKKSLEKHRRIKHPPNPFVVHSTLETITKI